MYVSFFLLCLEWAAHHHLPEVVPRQIVGIGPNHSSKLNLLMYLSFKTTLTNAMDMILTLLPPMPVPCQ